MQTEETTRSERMRPRPLAVEPDKEIRLNGPRGLEAALRYHDKMQWQRHWWTGC